MKKPRNQQLSAPQSTPFFIQCILLCILFFVAIGDGVRLIGSLGNSLTRAVIQAIQKLGQTIATHPSLRPLRTIEKPKKQTPPRRPIPKLTFPTIHIPPVHVPAFSFPAFPRLSAPIQWQSLILGILITIIGIFLPYNTLLFLKSLPNPQLLSQRDLEVSTKILDRNGQLLYEIYTDQNRTPVKLENIPLYVKQATLAIEDSNFYHHPGFSLRGIARAASTIIVHKQIQGGSTITQQLIKSALLTPEVTVVRKLKEIVLAFWAEHLYTKDQILEMYLNQVPYGGTAWGIESAAQTYFHKPVTQLSLAQAALLAGLPAAPSEYSPFGSHPELALQRQREVLSRMVINGYITKEEEARALSESITFAKPRIGIQAPHFVMYVKELLEEKYGPRLVERGGLRVTTSLDISIQNSVQEIVSSHIDSLANLSVGNGAALVTNPKTGEVLAMVGSRNYFDDAHDGNVNITTSSRQPGSSIKVVTYAAALESLYTAATFIDDSPISYPQVGGAPYAPVNYDGKFHGMVPLRYALANSYNIPAVKTLAAIGLPSMLAKAKQMGITSWSDPSRYGLSLTLGGGDVTMIELASVYGSLANAGKRVSLTPILKVTDYTGKVLEQREKGIASEAVKPEVAWILSDILADNQARTPAFGPASSLVIPNKTVSVKTGTTNEKRDNWTIGYTPSFVVAVWVGNNDNTPMNPFLTSGITGAAPIWHDIMTVLLENRPDEQQAKPPTILSIPCYYNKIEYFIQGTEPPNGRCGPLPTINPTPTVSP